MLEDAYGRLARSLRVSLTDQCNLRCAYCLPGVGLPRLEATKLLSDSEVVRLVSIALSLGIRKVRLTGGEPLLRPGLVEIVAAIADLSTDEGKPPEIALTTNGIGLEHHIDALRSVGLNRLNVSLDALDPADYTAITRRDQLAAVLRGLDAVDAGGAMPVKINAVVMRGINDNDVIPLADFALRRAYQLRFIEQMPLGPITAWQRDLLVTASQTLALLRTHFTLSPGVRPSTATPADEWEVAGDACHQSGSIGIIASVSNPFCAACDRTRLTADGQARACLFSDTETDLRALLRAGASDAEIAHAWHLTQANKPYGHRIAESDFQQPARQMSRIGG